MKRIVHIITVWLLVSAGAKAQYEVAFSHYFDMETAFNPAAAGKESKLNITGAYASDFTGFEHNPRTAYLAADAPFRLLNANHGAGASFMSDKIGLFTHQRITLQYAFHQPLWGGTLALGAQLGFLGETFDGSRLDAGQQNDPALPTMQVNGSSFDMALGLYYRYRTWYAGLSALHINTPTPQLGTNNELKITPVYYLTGGYNIKLRNPFLKILPTVLLRTDGTTHRADITGRLVYQTENRFLYGGLGYSPTRSVTVLVGGSFHSVHVGYSYEMYTSTLHPGNGSHELFVSYMMDIDIAKKGRNKHQSVRIL
nr:type IX secretion system membrane protein PorP/SprF [Hoylesella marshii]